MEINDKTLFDSYVIELGLKYCPIIDFDPDINDYTITGTSAFNVINRYNQNKILIQNKYEKYISDKNIQGCIEYLELDPELFWVLLLFVFDYSVAMCIEIGKTVEEQLQEFIDLIQNNTDVKLSLNAGNKKITIDNPEVINIIAHLCSRKDVDYDYYIFRDIKEKYNSTKAAYYFCDMLKYYFDLTVKDKRAVGAKISNKEKELLSYLLYFTGMSKNENLLKPLENNYNTIKGFINPKKKPDYKEFNKYY